MTAVGDGVAVLAHLAGERLAAEQYTVAVGLLLIAVVRAWVIARDRELDATLAANEATPLTWSAG